ncbi:MAG: hypothetical protein KDI55_16795 [Anaerolineae bacterium]|nr:hypothetical protein [Anaerolineae bacterium]
MESLTNIWSIVLLFVLRLGVPIFITLFIGYLLKRLDARWQAEARESRKAAEAAAAKKPLAVPKPAGQRSIQPLYALDASGVLPCWKVKGCTAAMQAACAASHQPNVACWQARTTAEGRLPSECKGCELHVPVPYVMAESRVLH